MGPWQVTLRAEPLLFHYALILITRKKSLHKSALSFEVAVAQFLGYSFRFTVAKLVFLARASILTEPTASK